MHELQFTLEKCMHALFGDSRSEKHHPQFISSLLMLMVVYDFRTSKSSSYRQDTKLIFDVRSWYLTER
jgi:hypothetical protein